MEIILLEKYLIQKKVNDKYELNIYIFILNIFYKI